MESFPKRTQLLVALTASLMLLTSMDDANAVASSGSDQSNCPPGQEDGPLGCATPDPGTIVYGTRGGLGDWPSHLFMNWGGSYTTTYDSAGSGGVTVSDVRTEPEEETQEDPCKKKAADATAAQPTSKRPVNVVTGEKILPEFDFSVPTAGVSLQVHRNYTKNLARTGIFGKKWTSSLDYSLVFEYQDVGCWTKLDSIVACNPGGKPLTAIYAYNPSGYPVSFLSLIHI